MALTAPANQNYTLDTAINNLTLPAATGGTAPLTYTLTSVPGLTFTPGTRTLSGTPSTAGTTTLTYEVTDANGASTNVDLHRHSQRRLGADRIGQPELHA